MNAKTKPHHFVGLDVHLRFTAVCILDANGRIVKEQAVKGHSPEVCQLLCESIYGTFDVVFEACDGYGIWHERLGRFARRVVVGHPNHLKAIWRMCRYDPIVRGWVDRVMHGQPKRKHIAVVAAAHKLARSMFAMLQTGEVWNPAA